MHNICTDCIFRHSVESETLCDIFEDKNYNADDEHCGFHTTRQQMIQAKLDEKRIQEYNKKKEEEDKQRFRQKVLSKRWELQYNADYPWTSTIRNRFSDEEINEFITSGEIPRIRINDYECGEEYYYSSTKNELLTILKEKLQRFIRDADAEILYQEEQKENANTFLQRLVEE